MDVIVNLLNVYKNIVNVSNVVKSVQDYVNAKIAKILN